MFAVLKIGIRIIDTTTAEEETTLVNFGGGGSNHVSSSSSIASAGASTTEGTGYESADSARSDTSSRCGSMSSVSVSRDGRISSSTNLVGDDAASSRKRSDDVDAAAKKKQREQRRVDAKKRGPRTTALPVVVKNFQPVIEPLEVLELNCSSVFEPLVVDDEENGKDGDNGISENGNPMTSAEREVVKILEDQQAVVKTIRNSDWTPFFEKFRPSENINDTGSGGGRRERHPGEKDGENEGKEELCLPYNSCVTPTTLLEFVVVVVVDLEMELYQPSSVRW